MKADKMDRKNIIIIVFGIAIIGLVFYVLMVNLNGQAYEQGRIDGIFQTAQTISTTYQIPIINNNTIQWIPIGQICGGQG